MFAHTASAADVHSTRLGSDRAAANGIDVFRIFDAMNDVRNLRVAIEAVKAAGKHAQGTIAYTTSPVHTIEAFVAQAKQMEAMGCDSVAIKDMAGLLTPYATGELVKALKAEQSLPVFIHSHDTAGLAAMCQLKAVENGADHIDTAISSFAWGTSHPGTESMVAALKGSEFEDDLVDQYTPGEKNRTPRAHVGARNERSARASRRPHPRRAAWCRPARGACARVGAAPTCPPVWEGTQGPATRATRRDLQHPARGPRGAWRSGR